MSLAIKEMQTKMTLVFHFMPVRMATVKGKNAGEDVGEKEPIHIVAGNVK
jgi:hypothetical protein